MEPPIIRRQLHPMDCQDIIIGKARGDLSNVGDYYTRDQSTPKRDEFYGGKNDLKAAIGWEQSGKTTIMFQKPINSDDAHTDNGFKSDITLIWAYGEPDDSFYDDDVVLGFYQGLRNKGFLGKLF